MRRKNAILYGIHLGLVVPGSFLIASSYVRLKTDFLLLMLATCMIAAAGYLVLRLVADNRYR